MKVYKILLYLAFVVSVAAISEEAFVKIKEQIRSNCLPKFPDLTEELLEKVNSGYEPENPPNYLKCYVRCVLDFGGVLTKKGEINKVKASAKLLLFLPDDLHSVALEALEKCFGVQNSYQDSCDKVWHFCLCFKHVNERLFNIP